MNTFMLSERKDSFEINAQICLIGRDILVILWGGTLHIGAIGIAQPRFSLKNARNISATSSVFTFLGHKEDEIAKLMSEELAKNLNRKVVVVAGIHWDGLKTGEIKIIIGICRRISEKIIAEIDKIV